MPDVLEMQSEAMNNLTPTDAGKFTGINTVLARAGIPVANQYSFANVVSQTDFVGHPGEGAGPRVVCGRSSPLGPDPAWVSTSRWRRVSE